MSRHPSASAHQYANPAAGFQIRPAPVEPRFRVLFHAPRGEYVVVDTWTEPTPRDVYFASRRDAVSR
jgi:hypothetical protein